MKIFGKEFGYKRWNFGVEWDGHGQRRLKKFESQAEAKAFYEKRRLNLCNPVLFRFRPTTRFEQFIERTMIRLGLKQPEFPND